MVYLSSKLTYDAMHTVLRCVQDADSTLLRNSAYMKGLLAVTNGSAEAPSISVGESVQRGPGLAPGTDLPLPDTHTLLTELSHDLRTPLNTIIGFSDILLSRRIGTLNAQQEKDLRIILKRGSELLGIIDQLVEYCKIIRQDVRIRQGLFALTPFLNTAVENLGESLQDKKIAIVYDPPALSCRLVGDEQKLHQVLRHIFEAGISLVKTGEILIGAKVLEGEQDALPPNRLSIEAVFVGKGGVKPASLFSWNGDAAIPAKVRFGMHLSNYYIQLMGGGLSVSQAKGRMVFQLNLQKEDL